MSEQSRARVRRDDEAPVDPPPVAAPVAAASTEDAELDSLLDEIDGVLETNAEEFVRSFVQKGGQ